MSDNWPPGLNSAFSLEANPSGAESESKAPKNVKVIFLNGAGMEEEGIRLAEPCGTLDVRLIIHPAESAYHEALGLALRGVGCGGNT